MSTDKTPIKKKTPTVTINDVEIPLLTGDLNAEMPLALVSQNVLNNLRKLLPKANFVDIKSDFAHKVMDCADMKEYVQVLREELEFHVSVNVINTFFIEKENANLPTVVAVN